MLSLMVTGDKGDERKVGKGGLQLSMYTITVGVFQLVSSFYQQTHFNANNRISIFTHSVNQNVEP